jgi:hypothetical protein
VKRDVAFDLVRSADALPRLVWPRLGPLVGGGEYVAVESIFSRDLDALAGIDAWQVRRDVGRMRGLACRVQWTEVAYDTFTIRVSRSTGSETEYTKRLEAIRSVCGWLYPALTIQAYVTRSTDRLLSAAAVFTRTLYEFAERERHRLTVRTNGQDGNTFIVVPWSELIAADVPVRTWRDLA